MDRQDLAPRFPQVGDGTGISHQDLFYREEIQLALRNRGMPLEGLQYDITPTGMHYLLMHFDIPKIDPQDWRLQVGGLVSKPLDLKLDDIKRRPSHTLVVTMECAGNGRALLTPRPVKQPWLVEAVSTASWTGVPLRQILEETQLSDKAIEIVFTGLDRGVQGEVIQNYQRSLTIEEAMRKEVILAYQMNGEELQPQHGYPLRLIVPGWYGMTSVKWLHSIEAVSQPFVGYQMVEAYRYTQSADDPGEPVSLMKVRALMVPPGIPDFVTRVRLVEAGDVTLTGRAWAGRQPVSRVEVSVDNGMTWQKAQLNRPVSPYAWSSWTYRWQASPDRYTLSVRAWDSEGNVQPTEQPWNYQGMGNNLVQSVSVIVE
ncbi:MAG TPA: sulfite oxidase [Dehalococcoidia bacterium]|nr:sulfite oxidase [Dehalococcoidia bacterium]